MSSPTRREFSRLAGAAAGMALGLYPTGQTARAQSYAQMVREANANTVTIVSGPPGETALSIAHDLATVLHCVNGIRVVPVAGRGDANNIRDLLFLRGIDMAIVRADVLRHLADSGELIDDLEGRIRYVAPLFEQEVHLIAGADVESVEDLDGRRVNIGSPGALALPAELILAAADVEVVESKFDNQLALERVVDGGLDAMFIVGGGPIPLLEQLNDVTGLHLVPIPPLAGETVYNVARFTHDDYPTLVEVDETVETISVPSLLAVYNWPSDSERFSKSRLFTETLFAREPYLRRPARHPKWETAALTDDVPGWIRFGPAQEIVDRIRASRAPSGPERSVLEPLGDGPNEAQMEELFEAQLAEFGIVPANDDERRQLFAAFRRRMEAAER